MRFASLFLILLASVNAQPETPATGVPHFVRFGASLPSPKPDAAVGVVFSLYRDQHQGAALWSEVQNVRADPRGGYTVLLGSTTNEGLPVELFNSAEPRWLEVEVDGIKQPRILLASVPYAIVAADARTLGGLPPSAYLRAPLTSSTPSADSPAIHAPVFGPRADATSGTPGYLGVFTNGTDLGNSALYQSGNTVSIGGTTSLGAFTLIGNAPSSDATGMALYNAGGGGGASVSLDMYNTYANGGIPQAKVKAIDDGNYSDHLTFWTKNPGAANNPVAERMRLTSTGNVGIGTTSPGAKLEVAGSLKLSGAGSTLQFPDGTVQTTGVAASATGFNIGIGPTALQQNSTGTQNTATGYGALQFNSTGYYNSAFGANALQHVINGIENTALGTNALMNSISGTGNTALGYIALINNFYGNLNTAVGAAALANNTGDGNTAIGTNALFSATAFDNTALGVSAGFNVTNGSYDVMIANQGTSSDDHTIRIGDVQTRTFIAGISGVNISGVPVVVSSTGQLGIATSSRRFKEDIHDMADSSNGLLRLRPVTYRYKQPYPDGSKPVDYGLIAEEVAEIYPDLVARTPDGQIQTVMYQKLTPMLLNEVQKLNDRVAQLEAMVHQLLTATGNPGNK